MKTIWISIGVAVFVVMGVAIALKERYEAPSGSLNLPDGSVVRIVGVTYGTNHVHGTRLAQMLYGWPTGIRERLMIFFNAAYPTVRTSTKPEMVVWLDCRTNGAAGAMTGYMEAFLSDGNNFVSGANAYNSIGRANRVEPLQFGVFPRRDREIAVHFYHHGPKGEVQPCGSLPFRNPAFGKFGEWQAESLPDTKRVGDVEVTVSGFHTDYDNSGNKNKHLRGESYSKVDLKIRSQVHTDEVWEVTGEEVSDVTGNRAVNNSISRSPTMARFMPSLWPREGAWKLNLEIKRTSGFRPEEMLYFKKVPLGELDSTNSIALTTNFNGACVTLAQVIRHSPNTNNSWSQEEVTQLCFSNLPLSSDTHWDLISATLDNGAKVVPDGWSSTGENRTYPFKTIPESAKTVDLVLAVQKSRKVEFLVKPDTN